MKKQEGGLRLKGVKKKSTDKRPLVSIITVVLNAAKDLEKTILSLQSQNYDNIEHIVIDGASSDGTLAVIKKYSNNIDYWLSENDRGLYDAMNKGAKMAKGRFLMFINAGDKLFHLDLSNLTKTASCYYYNEELSKIKRNPFTKFFLCRNTVCHQSIIYDRNDFIPFSLSRPVTADFKQMTKIVKNSIFADYNNSLVFFKTPVVSARNNKESLRQYIRNYNEKIKTVYDDMGLFYLLLALLHYFRNLTRFLLHKFFRMTFKKNG
ncbi:MAG: glycosyltransferase [Spirochaetia bacterium]|nr:glycosyltransferase [Spirochaetia bacterium]